MMTARRVAGWTAVTAALVMVIGACRAGTARVVTPTVADVTPKDPLRANNFPTRPAGGIEADSNRAKLWMITACADSMGMDATLLTVGTCMPCLPKGLAERPSGALQHARRLWTHIGRAPYDTTHVPSDCVAESFDVAKEEFPSDPVVDVELALFRLASRHDSIRTPALSRLDVVLDSMVAAGASDSAARVLESFARGVWDRAQRMLERPAELPLGDHEKGAHDLARRMPRLRVLPPIPRTSNRLGESEAEWSASLFDRAASLATGAGARSRMHRLALAPWVVLGRWGPLDSAATALLARAPGDSAVLPGLALAAYHRLTHPVDGRRETWALFDSALRRMPDVDSARHDSFDGVLTSADDAWRYGFVPADRERLDRRGWLVLDPIWSTPVNEVQLARRARVAEADIRFADLTKPGESGSETPVGALWVRQGAFEPAWGMRRVLHRVHLQRLWQGERVGITIENAEDLHRAFYKGTFAPSAMIWAPSQHPQCSGDAGTLTYADCAIKRRSDWEEVPFWGRTDSIDVSLARFRARGDSVDIYVGARVPLRRFRHRDATNARKEDRIGVSLWLTTPLGEPLFHRQEDRPLPNENLVAWTAQWSPRIGFREAMHRVEALEPRAGVAARGVLLHTSDEQVVFPLRGFGMSDLLVAASARERTRPAARWTDLDITPNGGVIAPRQTFKLAWEIYDLTPGPDGMVHWKVSLHRETGRRERREDMRAVLQNTRTAGDRIVSDDKDVPLLQYTRLGRPADAMVELIDFNLNDQPPGRHVVEVRVEDLVAKRTTSRSISVRVLPADAQKRR